VTKDSIEMTKDRIGCTVRSQDGRDRDRSDQESNWSNIIVGGWLSLAIVGGTSEDNGDL